MTVVGILLKNSGYVSAGVFHKDISNFSIP